ncbi:MAG: hypothetical protein WC356_00040 [Candidatus Micrarchaeia archaeon]|jgi:hypothetical protein
MKFKQKLFLLALATSLPFSSLDSSIFQKKSISESRGFIDIPLPKVEEKLQEKELTEEEILDDFLYFNKYHEAGVIVLNLLEKGNNKKYSRKELNDMFWKRIMEYLKVDEESRQDLLERYNQAFPKKE